MARKAPHNDVHIISKNPKTGKCEVVVHRKERGRLTSRTIHGVPPGTARFMELNDMDPDEEEA